MKKKLIYTLIALLMVVFAVGLSHLIRYRMHTEKLEGAYQAGGISYMCDTTKGELNGTRCIMKHDADWNYSARVSCSWGDYEVRKTRTSPPKERLIKDLRLWLLRCKVTDTRCRQ